jgi:hypothetical protein
MASYLEGFGLPVVEAGRLGCPVILSDLPVFREVAMGAGQTDFFPPGDVEGLRACIERSLARTTRRTTPASLAWPDWHGTAQQVHDILLGGAWYKTYHPQDVPPNAVPDDIGDMRMLSPLSPADRACSMRYVDGPLLADDGVSVQISVAIGNRGSALWTSNPGPGNGFHVNVGSHVIGEGGKTLDRENPRSPIPFAMPPGQEIVFPIRVSTDWLARGAFCGCRDGSGNGGAVWRPGPVFAQPAARRAQGGNHEQPAPDAAGGGEETLDGARIEGVPCVAGRGQCWRHGHRRDASGPWRSARCFF